MNKSNILLLFISLQVIFFSACCRKNCNNESSIDSRDNGQYYGTIYIPAKSESKSGLILLNRTASGPNSLNHSKFLIPYTYNEANEPLECGNSVIFNHISHDNYDQASQVRSISSDEVPFANNNFNKDNLINLHHCSNHPELGRHNTIHLQINTRFKNVRADNGKPYLFLNTRDGDNFVYSVYMDLNEIEFTPSGTLVHVDTNNKPMTYYVNFIGETVNFSNNDPNIPNGSYQVVDKISKDHDKLPH